jgi:hypothetical protein
MVSRLATTLVLAFCGLGTLGAAEIPRKSPEFVVTLPDGKEALVSQFRGNVLCLVLVLST